MMDLPHDTAPQDIAPLRPTLLSDTDRRIL
jgi:hypothetical protein